MRIGGQALHLGGTPGKQRRPVDGQAPLPQLAQGLQKGRPIVRDLAGLAGPGALVACLQQTQIELGQQPPGADFQHPQQTLRGCQARDGIGIAYRLHEMHEPVIRAVHGMFAGDGRHKVQAWHLPFDVEQRLAIRRQQRLHLARVIGLLHGQQHRGLTARMQRLLEFHDRRAWPGKHALIGRIHRRHIHRQRQLGE